MILTFLWGFASQLHSNGDLFVLFFVTFSYLGGPLLSFKVQFRKHDQQRCI